MGRVEPVLVELLLHILQLPLELARLVGEHRLVDRAGEVAVEQAILHARQLRPPLGQHLLSLAPLGVHIVERRLKGVAEPRRDFRFGKPEAIEVGDDRRFEVGLAPAHLGMTRRRLIVSAAVVDVRVVAAVAQLPPDPLAGDRLLTASTAQHASREHDLGLAGAAVATVEHVLAGLEGLPIDQQAILALEDLTVAMQLANVEAVAEDVRQGCAMKPWLAGLIDVAFGRELIGQRFEGVLPAAVELEYASHRRALLRMRDHRLIGIIDVHVPEGRQARGPALADLLVHALEHLGAQVVGVILRHGGHNVERQRPGGARTELVVHEGELDATDVLKLLKPDRVAHVAAHAVQLMGEDRVDLGPLRVGLHPLEHLVEGMAISAALGGLGDDELPDDGPSGLARLVAHRAELRIDGVALPLLAGGHPCPEHDIHRWSISFPASSKASPNRLTFIRISMASSSSTGRRYASDQTSMVSASSSSETQAIDSGRVGGGVRSTPCSSSCP